MQENFSIYQVLKKDIYRYFELNNLSRYANRAFWIKAGICIMLPLIGYLALLRFGEQSFLIVMGSYLLINGGTTLVVVNIAHDASHQCISRNKKVNKLLSYTWNIMGISKYLWELQHHRSHHNYTGIPQQDVDIDENFWIRYNPAHAYHSYYRYQHFYARFLYLLFGLYVVLVKDFIMLFSGKLRSFGIDHLPRYFLLRLIGTKVFYFFVILILPVLILPYPAWQLLLIYLLTLGFCSGLMLLVLVMPHINEDAVLQDTNIIKNQDDWTLHQLHTNVDSSSCSKSLNWLLGGLNTHLIHHLFPNICHVHFVELTRVIRETLRKRGITYRDRSFVTGVVEHFRFLRLMGAKPGQ